MRDEGDSRQTVSAAMSCTTAAKPAGRKGGLQRFQISIFRFRFHRSYRSKPQERLDVSPDYPWAGPIFEAKHQGPSQYLGGWAPGYKDALRA